MKINPELFVIPHNKTFFLYVPLQGKVLKVSSGVIASLQNNLEGLDSEINKKLIESQILVEDSFEIPTPPTSHKKYLPSHVTLIPTWNCNLKCTYCYSRGGEDAGEDMDFKLARSSIDFIIKNSKEKQVKEIGLSFHGGGEPLLYSNMGLIRKTVNYSRQMAKKQGFNLKISAATNGNLREKDLEWVVKNFDRLNISLDGMQDIQDRQRPKRGTGSSFEKVMNTLAYLEEKKFNYGLRATITKESVGKMVEIVDFFKSISSIPSFHLEPLFECGRCQTSKAKAPNMQEFLQNAIQAQKRAKEKGVRVFYSGSCLENIDYRFCGAAGSNFFVTPRGDITTCLEVSRKGDAMAEIFIIGRYNPQTQLFEFNENKIRRLRDRTVFKIEECSDCFAKYNCSGDCLAKVYSQTGNLYSSNGNLRCETNRTLLLEEIKNKM